MKYARTKIISKSKLYCDGENVLCKYVVMENEKRLMGFKLVAVVFWEYLEMLCGVYHFVTSKKYAYELDTFGHTKIGVVVCILLGATKLDGM